MAHLMVSLTLTLILTLAGHCTSAKENRDCSVNSDCGWNSFCHQRECQCEDGHDLSSNHRDCINVACLDKGCVDCSSDTTVCQRCVNFVNEDSGRCVDSCDGVVILNMRDGHLAKVCTGSVGMGRDVEALYIAITAGICSGFIITLLLGILFYWRMKKMRNDFSFIMSKGIRNLQIKEMENGQTQELFGYDNKAFEPDYHITQGSLRFEFKLQLTELRPHADTIVAMLNETRTKLASVPPQHNKTYVYKNVIHQLCRVLTLLKTPENSVVLPQDGIALLDWAKQILTEYQNFHNLQKNIMNHKSMLNSNHGNTVTLHQRGQSVTLHQNGHAVTLHRSGEVASVTEPASHNNNNDKDPCSTFRHQRNPFVEEQCLVGADDSLYDDLNVIQLLDDLTEPIEI